MTQMAIRLVGFAGSAAFIASYQIQSNRLLFLFQLIGSALFCFQFLLLGVPGSRLSRAVIILRNAMLMKYSDWNWGRWKGWPWIFFAVFVESRSMSTGDAKWLTIILFVCGLAVCVVGLFFVKDGAE